MCHSWMNSAWILHSFRQPIIRLWSYIVYFLLLLTLLLVLPIFPPPPIALIMPSTSTLFKHNPTQLACPQICTNSPTISNIFSCGYDVYNKNKMGICNSDNCGSNIFIYDLLIQCLKYVLCVHNVNSPLVYMHFIYTCSIVPVTFIPSIYIYFYSYLSP